MDNSTQIFNQMKRQFKQGMSTLPVVIGNEVVNWSKDSFKNQGFTDSRFMPWKKRQVNSKKNKGRAILVLTGRLKRSIRIVSLSKDSVAIGSDVPYAKAHNDGFNGTVTVKAHKRHSYSISKVGTGKLNKSGTERMQTVKAVKGSIDVGSYTRKMRMPQRRFLGNSFLMNERLKRVAALHLLKSLRNGN